MLRTASLFAILAAASCISAFAGAQERKVPETYTAVTTNMTPADVELKADILQWSDDDGRLAAIAALASDDPAGTLRDLPTLGIVWRIGSVIGHAVKYAHRTALPEGGEKITLVTDRRIGYTSFTPWAPDSGAPVEMLDYSVVEFRTGATGGGTLSLAAEVVIDTGTHTISLDAAGHAPLLTDVQKQPPPYWAKDD